jgi:hypothetical protein
VGYIPRDVHCVNQTRVVASNRRINKQKDYMKIFLTIICAAALSIAVANAQTSSSTETTTATTTTEATGTITDVTPGATLVLSTGSGDPVTYKFGKNVTYVNANGKVIDVSKLRKNRKVRVHYVKEGNDMIVDKVTIVKD